MARRRGSRKGQEHEERRIEEAATRCTWKEADIASRRNGGGKETQNGNEQKTHPYTPQTIIGSARMQGQAICLPDHRHRPIMFVVISTTLSMVSFPRRSCRHPFPCHENMKASHRRRRSGSPFLPPTSSRHLSRVRRMPSDLRLIRSGPKRERICISIPAAQPIFRRL